MMRTLFIVILALLACGKTEKKPVKPVSLLEKIREMKLDSTNNFGAKPSMLDENPISLSKAIFEKKVGKTIRVKGFVTKSCAKKGCWIVVKDQNESIRVTFKDYGFFVPLGFQDENIVMEGVLSEKKVTEEERRHFAKDEGKSDDEIQAIVGSETKFTFKASSLIKLAK